MKRCPSCQRTYMDDAQSFCANDGTPLVEENAPPSDLQKTMLASGPPSYTPPEQGSWPPPPAVGQTPPGMGGQQPGWGQTPPPNPYGQQPYGGQQQYGGQQPYGQTPYGQPGQQQWGGGGYLPPGGAAGAYAATDGGQRKGLSIAALVLGILSALGAILFLTGLIPRYYYVSDYRFRTDGFILGSLIASALGGLAVILGIIALIFAISKAARWAGKGPAAAAIILGLFGAITSVTLSVTSSSFYPSSSNSNSNSNSNRSRASSNSNNSNGSTTYSNRNGSTTATNSNSSNSNSSASSSMTEDEKYRIFYAAGKTNDRALQTEIAQLIGIIDANGQPTAYYQTFVGGAGAWALRDSSFPRTVATPEAARAYVMAHR